MNVDQERLIRYKGKELGPISIRDLTLKRQRSEIDNTAEFLSVITNDWKPIIGFIIDFAPNRNDVEKWKQMGFKYVQVLGMGGGECPACKPLITASIPIDDAPTLPPANCTCIPWCGLCMGVIPPPR